jgi:GT2 family glycosyltransferase
MPEVRLVRLEKNYPYSYSVNRGIEAAKGEFLCFMNNDTIVVQPEWLSILIDCAKSEARIGIVGPRLFPQNLVDRTRRDPGWLPRYILPDGSHVDILPSNDTVTPCTYVVGACFLVKRKLIDDIGLFDEGFFFAYDETDYCLRAWKAGRKVVCNTQASVVHLVSKTKNVVTDKDYEYNLDDYEDPEKRFYRKHSSKDFEMILRQAKGPAHFCLWKIRYMAYKALNLVRQRARTQAG